MNSAHPPSCPGCGKPAELVTGKAVLPDVDAVANASFWQCEICDYWVGCHEGSMVPMGRLANSQTRALKRAAHDSFDPLWTSGQMTRTQAYKWLRGKTGLGAKECHIGWLSDEMLVRLPELCTENFRTSPPRSP